jgi:hypothetical protein
MGRPQDRGDQASHEVTVLCAFTSQFPGRIRTDRDLSGSACTLGGLGWNAREARRVASENHALVDRRAALNQGAGDAVIARLIRQGLWKPVHPGVYYLNVTPADWTTTVHAAVMAAGPDALASHRTASVLWGLDGVRGQILELTVPFRKDPAPAGVIVHRTRRPLPQAVAGGVPVTRVERTLLDLSAQLPPIVLEKALMSALHKGLTTSDLLAFHLGQQGGRGVKGTKKLRSALSHIDDGTTGSPSELDLMTMLRSAPIPLPRCQFEITFPEGDHAYPDFAWPDRGKCIEVDGFDAHGTPEALERDLVRQNRLLDLGWDLRRYSARRIRRQPTAVVNEIIHFVTS